MFDQIYQNYFKFLFEVILEKITLLSSFGKSNFFDRKNENFSLIQFVTILLVLVNFQYLPIKIFARFYIGIFYTNLYQLLLGNFYKVKQRVSTLTNKKFYKFLVSSFIYYLCIKDIIIFDECDWHFNTETCFWDRHVFCKFLFFVN